MKGILFRPEVWQAKLKVLEHGEAQTRRVIKPQPTKAHSLLLKTGSWAFDDGDGIDTFVQFRKPHYQVGEIAYVKEAWYYDSTINKFLYQADRDGFLDWKSPFFMPERAARYFVKFTGVKAGRVQEITEEEAIKEGCGCYIQFPIGSILAGVEGFRAVYQCLWNSINAKWKRVYNKKLKIYEFWQFPWSEANAKPMPKTEHPERYHCVPKAWVFAYSFKLEGT